MFTLINTVFLKRLLDIYGGLNLSECLAILATVCLDYTIIWGILCLS